MNANPSAIENAIHDVQTERDFIQKILLDCLHWNIPEEAETFESISYEWTEKLRPYVEQQRPILQDGHIWQIQKMNGNPWGVFVIEFADSTPFETGRGITTPLRQMLRALVTSGKAHGEDPVFDRDNLLFICTYDYEYYTIAHFRKAPTATGTPPLAAFGWGPGDPIHTVSTLNLPALHWQPDATEEDWTKQWASAFDVEKVTADFFKHYDKVFRDFQNTLSISNAERKRMVAQTIFNRLFFLRFIERKGWLEFNGEKDYLRQLYRAKGYGGKSFFQGRLRPLFFDGLAKRHGEPSEAFGDVPFLNGGLFSEGEYDPEDLDIPDSAFEEILGEQRLFYKYNFTVDESSPTDIEVAVDPEMLGKVFEKLVTGKNERKAKGSYYTPRTIVSFMCREAIKGYLRGTLERDNEEDLLEALVDQKSVSGLEVSDARDLLKKLRVVTVCDPACGSGAYLVGMLHELFRVTQLLDTTLTERDDVTDYDRKLDIIKDNIYGVDLDEYAVNIAMLRLWLTLVVEFSGPKDQIPALPNLDFEVEVGDSLSVPKPAIQMVFSETLINDLIKAKKHFQRAQTAEEKQRWDGERTRLEEQIAEWPGIPRGKKGFNWWLRFVEVMKDDGFDIMIANPPYGVTLDTSIRDQYFPNEKQSKDSYGLFMARGLELLKPKGIFTFIITDTWRTLSSHLPLRHRILNTTSILHVLDLPDWIFDAVVNTGVLTVSCNIPDEEHETIVADLRAIPANNWQKLDTLLASVSTHGPDIITMEVARHTINQSLFRNYPREPVFISSAKIAEKVFRFDPFQRKGTAVQGLATGCNQRYLRQNPESGTRYDPVDFRKVIHQDIVISLTESEKSKGIVPAERDGKIYLPYEKGGSSDASSGWLPCYKVEPDYYIEWTRESVRDLKTWTVADAKRFRGQTPKPGDERRLASRLQNKQFYFKSGIAFSFTGVYSPTFRFLEPSVFDKDGSGIFSEDDDEVLIGIFNSLPARYIFKTYLNHTINMMQGDILSYPLPEIDPEHSDTIKKCVTNIIRKQSIDKRYRYDKYEQKLIDAIVNKLYDISKEDEYEIMCWFIRRYPILAAARNIGRTIESESRDMVKRNDYLLARPNDSWRQHPWLMEIAQGEKHKSEFKQTLEHPVPKPGQKPLPEEAIKAKRPKILFAALKTIAAFLNADGGVLYLGVADWGEPTGIEPDFQYCKKKDADGFELKLRSLLKDRFTPQPLTGIKIEFDELDGKMVCRVEVPAISRPNVVHLDGDVYIRDGNQTLKLEGEALTRWVQDRSQSS